MGLALGMLVGAGCATVTPCLELSNDGQPVMVDFGDGISMRIDRVFGREHPQQPFVVHGIVRNNSSRHWRSAAISATLDFQQESGAVAPARAGDAPTEGIVSMELRSSVMFLGPGDTVMERKAGCVGQPRDCVFKGLQMGNWQMEMEYRPQPALKDGICRRLVGVRLARRSQGTYPLRPRLALLEPGAARMGTLTIESARSAGYGPPTSQPSADAPVAAEPGNVAPTLMTPADAPWMLNYDGHFEDDQVELNLYFTGDELHLSMENRSDQAMRIEWDRLVWVDSAAYAMPLVRVTAKTAHTPMAEPPALIPAGARLKVALLRDDGHLPTADRPPWRFQREPFIRNGPTGEGQVGQTLGLYLPLVVGEVAHPLDLRFRIEALEPTREHRRANLRHSPPTLPGK